jgi:hypothetical protein
MENNQNFNINRYEKKLFYSNYFTKNNLIEKKDNFNYSYKFFGTNGNSITRETRFYKKKNIPGMLVEKFYLICPKKNTILEINSSFSSGGNLIDGGIYKIIDIISNDFNNVVFTIQNIHTKNNFRINPSYIPKDTYILTKINEDSNLINSKINKLKSNFPINEINRLLFESRDITGDFIFNGQKCNYCILYISSEYFKGYLNFNGQERKSNFIGNIDSNSEEYKNIIYIILHFLYFNTLENCKIKITFDIIIAIKQLGILDYYILDNMNKYLDRILSIKYKINIIHPKANNFSSFNQIKLLWNKYKNSHNILHENDDRILKKRLNIFKKIIINSNSYKNNLERFSEIINEINSLKPNSLSNFN